MTPEDYSRSFAQLIKGVRSHVYGKDEKISLSVMCLLAEGHLLLEDMPGVGKTKLAGALAEMIGGRYTRIQGTPDLMPSDIIGSNVYYSAARRFRFITGPIFANVVLCDEINRATPRTQSALLEAMAERQITPPMEKTPRRLDRPFMVLATQNPAEYAGTYPLPEAQLDRFLMRLHLDYPGFDDEVRILRDFSRRPDTESAEGEGTEESRQVNMALVKEMMAYANQEIHVNDPILDRVARILDISRNDEQISYGASPRAGLDLLRIARVRAATEARDHVRPVDIDLLAPHVLSHRITLAGRGRSAPRALADAQSDAVRRIVAGLLADHRLPVQSR